MFIFNSKIKRKKKKTHNIPVLSPQHHHLCDLRFFLVFLTNSTRNLYKILWIIITRSQRHSWPSETKWSKVCCPQGKHPALICLSQILPQSHSRSSRREHESSHKYYKALLYLDTDWRGINESLKRISAASLALFSGYRRQTIWSLTRRKAMFFFSLWLGSNLTYFALVSPRSSEQSLFWKIMQRI